MCVLRRLYTEANNTLDHIYKLFITPLMYQVSPCRDPFIFSCLFVYYIVIVLLNIKDLKHISILRICAIY